MDEIDPYVLRDDDDLDSYLSRANSVPTAEPPSTAADNPYALRDDDDLDSYFERVKAADAQPPPEGTLSQMGSQFVAGGTDLKKMFGQFVQAFTPEDSAPYQWGGEVAENAEKAAAEYEPDLRDKNEVQKALIRGSRAIVPSIATLPAYAAGPVAGAAATTALFGGSQFQDTEERLLAEGVPENEATKAALLTGAIQGGGEAVANKLTLGLLGAGKKAAAAGIKGITSEATDQAILKPFAKSLGAAAIGEPATEITQDVGTEAVERAYTGKPSRDYGDIAYESGTTALAMTAILGPFGAGGHYANSRIAKRINTALDDPTVPAEKRQAEVDRIHARAKNVGVQDADVWREQALVDIANGAPIRREVVPPGESDGQNISPTGPGQPGTPVAGAPVAEGDVGLTTDGTEPPIAAGQPGGRTATGVDGESNLTENAGTELPNENANLGGPALDETRKRTRDYVARVNEQFSDLSKLRMGKNMRDALVANGIDPTQETPQSGFEKLSAIANTKTEDELKQEKAAKLAESGPIGRAAGASVLSGAAERVQAEQQAQTEAEAEAEAEAQKETGKIAVTVEEAAAPETTQTVEPAEQGTEPYSPEALAAVPDDELSVLFRNASKSSDGEQRKAIREAINAERNRRIETQPPVAPEVANAETVRSDQGQLDQTREVGEGGEVDSGSDLYQPEQGSSQGGEGTALGQRNLQQEESKAPIPQAVTPEAVPKTPLAEEAPTIEETTIPTEATQPPGPISDESQNQAPQERPLETETQKVEPKRVAQIKSVIDKLDAKVAEKGSMGLNFVTAPLRKAATDLGVYDENATPDQTVANIRAKLTELTPPAPEVVGKGRSGDVVRIGNEVEKNALNDEGKLYSLLADKEGIAKGYEKEGKVRLPYYKHVVSVDTIAPEKRAQLRGLVAKNASRINRAMSELTNTGYSYNDPLQFGMDESKKFDLLDFSNAQKSENPLIDNLSALSGFYKQFGAEHMANAVSQVGDVLNFQQGHAKDGAEGLIGDAFEGVNYRDLTERLGGPATNAYFTSNARGINIPDAAQTDIINGVKTVLTTRPLTEQEIGEWELTPVVENLKSDIRNKVQEKTQAQPTERLLRGNPNPATIKKLYEKESPVIGDRFITPGGNSWTVASISRAGDKSKIVIKNDKVNRSLEIYTNRKWGAEESDAQFSVQPQEHPVDAAGKLVVTHPENGQTAPKDDILNGNYAKAPVMFGDLPVAIENGVGSVREGVDRDGQHWKHELKDNYGEITGVQGADKDHLDVFIKPQLTKEAIDKTDTVYIVDQIDAKSDPNSPKFDESKIMMGYDSLPEAKAAYFRNYQDGWKGMGAITPVKMADFKNWLKSGKTTQQFAPTLKAQGATEAQNLNPANIRGEILPLFTNLENAQPKEVRKAAMEQIAAHPLAERLQYVQDNFYDLLLDLEQNKKVDIKC